MFLTHVKYPVEIIHIYGRKDCQLETDYSNPVGLNFTEFAGGFQIFCSRKDCQKTGSRAAFSLDLSLRTTLLVFSNEELIL